MSERRKGQCGEYRKVFISHTIPPASPFCLEGTTDSGSESSGLVYVRMPRSMRAREDSAVHVTPFPARTRASSRERASTNALLNGKQLDGQRYGINRQHSRRVPPPSSFHSAGAPKSFRNCSVRNSKIFSTSRRTRSQLTSAPPSRE
jgi:hypothetical protein